MALSRHASWIEDFHEEHERLPSRVEWEARVSAEGLPRDDGWGRPFRYTIVERERASCCRGQWAFLISSLGRDEIADDPETCAAPFDERLRRGTLDYEGDLIAGGRLHPGQDRTRVRWEFVQSVGK